MILEHGNTSGTIKNTSETSNYGNKVILHEQGNVLRTRKYLGT